MLSVVVPVAGGALIGYVTNWLAIKMLFWPHEPKFVFGHRVPFTPGLFVGRRQEFSVSLSRLMEEKFVNPEQLHDLFKRAEESGVIEEFLNEMGPVFKLAYNFYWSRTPEDVFREDCQLIVQGLRSRHVVGETVVKAMNVMTTDEIEDMIMIVVHRELRGITWCGAGLGALIGVLQIWVR